jgi:hypothetical protein
MDDSAPVPIAPEIPAIEEQQEEANQNDQQTAQAYWHPAWSKVQEMFEQKLEAYKLNGALAHQQLPADEFKIRMMVDAHVNAVLEEIMEDVKRAVESVESTTGSRTARRNK